MIANETLVTLEFDAILRTIARFAHCDASRDEILALRPLAEHIEIVTRAGQVDEIRSLARQRIELPLRAFDDITPVLAAVRPVGAVLDPRDLRLLCPALEIMAAVGRQFAYRADIPLLQEVAAGLAGFPDILEALERSIDGEGNILDTASKLLFDLRAKKRALTARIRRRLEEIVRERQTAIFLQDDFITQRNGRWVIPVRMDSKGMVPGVVHDVSNTGETAFMEPLEIIGLANELENLVAEEKAEQIRIVREICGWVREDADEMDRQFRAVVRLDLLNAIARFGELVGGNVPEMGGGREVRLVGACHPLLLLMEKERGGSPVVPLDLALGEGNSAIVITGPNAGGKTIALKTVGLLILMAQTGIPVPAAADSVFPLVDDLLIDIGDEQSIEQSLSTFSAHVSSISRILSRAGKRTLVLLDELGTGTEPGQGAAIACAVLRELLDRGALVLATTHLTDIIGFVHRTDGMVNAAMEFDRQRFTPLYRLTVGEPGQSHAIEIARRYGLPDRVIAFALEMAGTLDTQFHGLLAELKEHRQRFDEKLAELDSRETALAAREREAKARHAGLEARLRAELEEAFGSAREIIAGARREVNAILDEARREKSREAKRKLEEAEAAVAERQRALHPGERLSLERLKEGDTVFVRSIGYDGTVTAIDRRQGRLRVRAGIMDLDVALSDLAPRQGKTPQQKSPARRTTSDDTAPDQLNLVGRRVDDALAELDRFLNHASLERAGELRIIHGKGTGALMRAVRAELDGHPLVREFRRGAPEEGGDGVTVVTLR